MQDWIVVQGLPASRCTQVWITRRGQLAPIWEALIRAGAAGQPATALAGELMPPRQQPQATHPGPAPGRQAGILRLASSGARTTRETRGDADQHPPA